MIISLVAPRDYTADLASPEGDRLSPFRLLAHGIADRDEHVLRGIAEGHVIRREIVERAEIRVPAVTGANRIDAVAAVEHVATVVCQRQADFDAAGQRFAEL